MKTSRFSQKRHWGLKTDLQHILFLFIALCVIGIGLLALVGVRMYQGNTSSSFTPIPLLSPTTMASSSVTLPPSPTPLPSPSPTPTPFPTPMPAPGVLGYPLSSGDPHLPEIALTFDDGPNLSFTPHILALLQRYGVKATFFVIGSEATAHTALVQQEYQQGHAVEDHTWSHPDLTSLSPSGVLDQLQRTAGKIQALTDEAPLAFRPPGGHFNRAVQSLAASLGLTTVLWSVDPRDWSKPGATVIIQRVLDAVHNGSIILLHDGGGDRSETVAALPTIITPLKQRGFRFVTIPRMIQDLPPDGTGPGQIDPDQRSSASPGGTFSGGADWPGQADRQTHVKAGNMAWLQEVALVKAQPDHPGREMTRREIARLVRAEMHPA
ncbi:MAG TPA: polysaccharide deacetylase family protein [Ktedonobacteraceae bacterium]|nr:polysaccharide deacetylase family protein [Ktedonobacteraceae bacterium]